MPAGITREEVVAIAALAELDLEPAEVERLGRELGDILAYAEQVQRVDTTGVLPTTGAAAGLVGDRWVWRWPPHSESLRWPMRLNRSLRAASSRCLA